MTTYTYYFQVVINDMSKENADKVVAAIKGSKGGTLSVSVAILPGTALRIRAEWLNRDVGARFDLQDLAMPLQTTTPSSMETRLSNRPCRSGDESTFSSIMREQTISTSSARQRC